ncbi:ABC transporter permease, partial [Planctomycetota bacterium]
MRGSFLGAEVPRYWRLVWTLLWMDLRGRYAGSVLGGLWAVAEPLAVVVVYVLVFSVFLAIKVPTGDGVGGYGLFLCSGMLPWFAISATLSKAATSFPEHGAMIRRTPFPLALVACYQTLAGIAVELCILMLVVIGCVTMGGALSLRPFALLGALPLQVLVTIA